MTASGIVAVTGAAGFIGSHVAAVLAAAGVSVRVLTGPPEEARHPVRLSADFSIAADITDQAALEALFSSASVVVHAAGPPSVTESFVHPAEYMRAHALGTSTVLEACVRCRVGRIVYISSAEVYGNLTPPFVSETQALLASSPYGAAKIGAEQMVRAFAAAGKLQAVVLRPFSVYGPDMSPSSVVFQFLQQGLAGDVICVRDPVPIRDFCFVSDIARAVAAACTVPVSGLAIANLGSGVGTSIGDLARLTAELTGAPGIREAGEKRPAGVEVRRLIANTASAGTLLGWTASTPLRDGLLRTLDEIPR